ncbi:MAG TPA: DNA alkylation repair protein [Phototrophicaceae bacterium]|jgi:3-methyladenine DNA glycosylase AlkD|nr:DNA alkylation repair protein [Phototrophicaceae bacterium]
MSKPKARVSFDELIQRLEALANPDNIAGMQHFGIHGGRMLGISLVALRQIAKEIVKDHTLADQLWSSGIHEARILASIIDDYKQVTPEQMERWVQDFDSWDVCDQCCGNLFALTPSAWDKAVGWSSREAEFVKRAGFVLMAQLSHKSQKARDDRYPPFLTIIEREAHDDRNFVKKAVNWALRQIGKRNRALNTMAIETALKIRQQNSKAAQWVAKDALKELQDAKIQSRLKT